MKKLSRLSIPFFAVLFCFHTAIVSASEQYTLTVKPDRETAIYKKGETATFRLVLTQNAQPVSGKNLRFSVQGDGNYRQNGSLVSSGSDNFVRVSLPHPGFIFCRASCEIDGQNITAIGGAGFDPLEIQTKFSEPEDFDEFWNAKKAEVAQMPLNPKIVRYTGEKAYDRNVEVYDVTIDCPGGMPVSGYLCKPANAQPKSLPIILEYHGAGVRSSVMIIGDAGRGALVMDVNAHGIPNGKPAEFYTELESGKLRGYQRFGSDDREKIYFTGMYQRILRSLQFMKSLPEWDGKTLVVRGSSQGGGQALVAAGLDPDVTFCVSYVAAICYPLGSLEGNLDGWPGFLRGQTEANADPKIVKAVQYVDAVNFAKRIKAESVLTVGFVDTTCSPTSVYLAFNAINAPKHILPTPDAGHTTPAPAREAANRLVWEHINRNKQN